MLSWLVSCGRSRAGDRVCSTRSFGAAAANGCGTRRHALSRLWSGAHYLLCRVPRWRQIVWACQQLLRPGECSCWVGIADPVSAATKDAVTITAIAGKRGGGQDGDLLAWRSTDHGKTWGQPAVLNDVTDAAREGLHGFAAGPGNVLFAVWLDLRKDESSEGGTKLYGTISRDGGKTWEKNARVYASPEGTICQCCHPSVAIDAKGVLHVMWRNALNGSRDLYYTASIDGGKTFASAQKLGHGTWTLNACPMDGGDMTTAGNGQIDSVWRRQEEIFAASPGKEEQVLGKGRNPVIAYGSKWPLCRLGRYRKQAGRVPQSGDVKAGPVGHTKPVCRPRYQFSRQSSRCLGGNSRGTKGCPSSGLD